MEDLNKALPILSTDVTRHLLDFILRLERDVTGERENTKNLWNELDECKWNPIPSLGSEWLGKWKWSKEGYTLIVSDGIDIWGEQRNESYIQDKSQEWAVCLECGVGELAELVLSQLKEKDIDLRILPNNLHSELAIELTALLDQLPYNWAFYLSKLPHHVTEHHWTLPLSITLEFMSERIVKLEEELKRKIRQLEEHVSPESITRKEPEVVINSCLNMAVQNVIRNGVGSVLCSHLSRSPIISKLNIKRKQEQANRSDGIEISTLPHNRPRTKCKRPVKGVFGEDTVFERQISEEEQRRNQIHVLTQAPVNITAKKKKKLNI